MSVEMPDRESISVLFRVEGRGTKALAKARVGDEIDLLGPLGRPFDLSPFGELTSDGTFHVKQSPPNAIMVGGGVGVPPLVYLSQLLNAHGVAVHSIIGARSAKEILGWNELAAECEEVYVATDDGSRGQRGRVTDLLAHPLFMLTEEIEGQEVKPIVYACGPLPMLRAVAQLCATEQVRCQVSLEENMPCGIGVCNGCVVRTLQPFAEENGSSGNEPVGDLNRIIGNEWSPYQSYRRVCVEGPACWADEIDWEYPG